MEDSSSVSESPPDYPSPGPGLRRHGHPDLWNSWGFVEVGEQKGAEGYPMRRTRSSLFSEHGEEHVPTTYRLLENRLSVLQRELVTIKRKVDVFEEDASKTNKWGVKYSRRLTLVANVALGLFVFVSRFLKRIQARKNKIIQNMMVPNGTASDTFNGILNEAYIQSIAKSWYFFVAAICLASDTAWKRNVGITISTVASMWPILKNRYAWAHYLSLVASAAYIFAEWATQETKEANVKTLSDFIGPYVEPSSGAPSASQTPRYIYSSVRSLSMLEDGYRAPLIVEEAEQEASASKGYLPHTASESNILGQSIEFKSPTVEQ